MKFPLPKNTFMNEEKHSSSPHKESDDRQFFGKGQNSKPFFNSSFIQPKLSIGQPNDSYEKEADAMADKVVQPSASPSSQLKQEIEVQAKPSTNSTPLAQAKCAACEQEEKLQKKEDNESLNDPLQKKPIFESNRQEEENRLQRKCAACEREEQVSLKSEAGSNASATVESRLGALTNSGSPLPSGTRREMEESFGADFSSVRIHNDSTAVQMSKELHAQAFTHGNDVYFNSGKYDPDSTTGKHLLAHELTHTIQQGNQVRKQDLTSNTNTSEVENTSLYEELKMYFKNADLENAKNLISNLNSNEKDYVLSSNEFMVLATRDDTGGADFGDEQITQLMEAFLSNGYQNLYGCLTWMFFEFDADDTMNNVRFVRIINLHQSEDQKAFARSNFRNQFSAALNDVGVCEVVEALGGPLDQKLKWIKDKGVTSFFLAKDVVIDHLRHNALTKEESDNIFAKDGPAGDMRWYFGRFIDVGDYEMVEIISLLNFELYQKLDWMIYEDTNPELVLHVVGSATIEEVEEVLDRQELLDELKESLGDEGYEKVFQIMNRVSESEAKNISTIGNAAPVLDSTIDEELKLESGDVDVSAKKVYILGTFLLNVAKDEVAIAIENPDLDPGYKSVLTEHLVYVQKLLDLYNEYPKDSSKYEKGINEMAKAGQKAPTIVQAQEFTPAVQVGRLPPPELPLPRAPIPWTQWAPPPEIAIPEPPAIPELPGLPEGGIPKLPGGMPEPVVPVGPSPWTRLPLPPIAPFPGSDPGNGGKHVDKSGWRDTTSDELKFLRRTIEYLRDLRKSKSAEPTPDTETQKEQSEEKNKKKKARCYGISKVFNGRMDFVDYANTPEDLRTLACKKRSDSGTEDPDFQLKNIAVGRFIVEGEIRYIAAANPQFMIHSEDEIMRIAETRFGTGNYVLDALFSERVPCRTCSTNITSLKLEKTESFRVYCIVHNDRNWRNIRRQYYQGI